MYKRQGVKSEINIKIEQVESKMQKVLAIETSCDETSVSIVSNIEDTFRIHSNIIASQIEDHSKWGGVVPELAARKHLELLPFVLDKALEESKIKIEEIDYIASTVAPGLVGCLRVGSITARSLCMLHSKPFLGIHHLEGHLSVSYTHLTLPTKA